MVEIFFLFYIFWYAHAEDDKKKKLSLDVASSGRFHKHINEWVQIEGHYTPMPMGGMYWPLYWFQEKNVFTGILFFTIVMSIWIKSANSYIIVVLE